MRIPICVPPARVAVFLLGRDGSRRAFSSLLALSHWLSDRVSKARGAYRHWDLSIGSQFSERIGADWLGAPHYRQFDYVIRDGLGGVVEPAQIPAPAWAAKRRRRAAEPIHTYRVDPVARTGAHRWRYSDSLRYPRTQAERRAAFAPLEEHEPAVRSRRSAVALPTAWEDGMRHCERNWKRHRHTQWKPD